MNPEPEPRCAGAKAKCMRPAPYVLVVNLQLFRATQSFCTYHLSMAGMDLIDQGIRFKIWRRLKKSSRLVNSLPKG